MHSLSLWLLSSPWMSQGELHSYCTASYEGEVGFHSQSPKAGDTPAQQLPDNGTDCGWAPFGEFSVCALAFVPWLRLAIPTGLLHRWQSPSWLADLRSSDDAVRSS